MLAQYLDSSRETNSRKSNMINDKAVNSSQATKEGTFHAHMLVASLIIIVQNIFYDYASVSVFF